MEELIAFLILTNTITLFVVIMLKRGLNYEKERREFWRDNYMKMNEEFLEFQDYTMEKIKANLSFPNKPIIPTKAAQFNCKQS